VKDADQPRRAKPIPFNARDRRAGLIAGLPGQESTLSRTELPIDLQIERE